MVQLNNICTLKRLLVKPELKCLQFSKFKAEYEKKISVGEANIDEAVAECEAVTAQHAR